MAQTYVHGITDTVTHDVTSGLTACPLEATGPALVIWTITPTAAGRYSPGRLAPAPHDLLAAGNR
jgi:hypothetical protein